MLDTSIIITNYNRAEFLGRAIRSCLKQSLDKSRYEIIVVDDGSTDNSRVLISSFEEDGIIPIFLNKNGGVANASNEGIKKARGAFVMRVDSDDFIAENTLLFLTEIMSVNPEIGFVYTDHIRVNEKEKYLKRVDINTLDKLLNHGAGIIFRKTYLETIGLYDKIYKQAEDYDLIKRYLKNFNGYHFPMPLYRYTRHSGNITGNRKQRNEYIRKSNSGR